MEKSFDIPTVKLNYKQKLILEVLQDEFNGKAFGPELLENSENEDIKKLSINEITWNILRLRDDSLIKSEKKIYKNRVLNEYSITDYIIYDAVNII